LVDWIFIYLFTVFISLPSHFRCQAKNQYGEADTRANYNVEVEEAVEPEQKREFAPKFNPGLEDQQLNAGEPLHLYCRVEANPAASVTFYKDGLPIRATDRVQLDYNVDTGECHLRIEDCAAEDAGQSGEWGIRRQN
jgi:hypothetical protein